MLCDWTDDLTVLPDGHPLTEAERDLLAGRGVRIVEGRVEGVRHRERRIEAVEVEGGAEVDLGALYLVTRSEPASGLPGALGLAMEEGSSGRFEGGRAPSHEPSGRLRRR